MSWACASCVLISLHNSLSTILLDAYQYTLSVDILKAYCIYVWVVGHILERKGKVWGKKITKLHDKRHACSSPPNPTSIINVKQLPKFQTHIFTSRWVQLQQTNKQTTSCTIQIYYYRQFVPCTLILIMKFNLSTIMLIKINCNNS